VGIDIDPQRIREANENLKIAGVGDRVKFLNQDLFTTDISEATVVTLYLLPSLNLRLIPKLNSQLKPGTRVVSHSFDMGSAKPLETLNVNGRTIYFWTTPDPAVTGAPASRVDPLGQSHTIPETDSQFRESVITAESMLQAFIITLREGLEAFLIIAISLAYLRKSGRPQLVPAVHWGIARSVVLSVGAAILFQRASNQALWEGVLALTAASSSPRSSCTCGGTPRPSSATSSIACRVGAQVGIQAAAGVFLFTLLMITREGMETALLMGTLVAQGSGALNLMLGAAGGVMAAAALAWLWSRYGHRVNLALFFQVTAVFLAVFVVQL
jgi:high-affinity iron transporter